MAFFLFVGERMAPNWRRQDVAQAARRAQSGYVFFWRSSPGLGRKTIPVVRQGVVQIRPLGHDPVAAPIDARIVAGLEKIDLRDLGHPRILVEIEQVVPQVGLFVNVLAVALEHAVIDVVVADQGGKPASIGLGHAVRHPTARRTAALREHTQGR